MEKTEIAALLEALCERPLADGQAEGTAELQAFCREAAEALSQAGDVMAGAGADSGAEADRLTAALASLLSGSDADSDRRTLAEAVLRSAAVRLDAQSALAFVDAIARAPLAAPAHLVDDMLAADRAADVAAAPRPDAGMSGLWSLIAGGSWSARR